MSSETPPEQSELGENPSEKGPDMEGPYPIGDEAQPAFDQQKPMYDEDPNKPPPQPAKLLRRADWGAKPPKWIQALETPVKKVVLTWTETETCLTEEECITRVREIQKAHMEEEGVPDIKHNFLVGGDGALYEGRGYTRVGPTYPDTEPQAKELTGKSIEIAFIQKHVINPSDESIKAASDCLAHGGPRYVEENFTLNYVCEGKVIRSTPVSLKTLNLPQ